MFGYAAFAELPFATIGARVVPPAAEIMLGGHFGFDERNKHWEEEKQQEAKRREKIKTALFGLPPEQREQIAPTETINIAAQTVITYDAVMVQIETLRKRIEFERDEEDFETLLELL